MKSIIIFIDYFGKWPDWFDMFLESCRANPTINWCIHTDCASPESSPSNVQFEFISFSDYCARVSRVLGVNFAPHTAYNVCNLKPMYGHLYKELHKKYDYYGWGDLDVIYGDIRSIYLPAVLEAYVISSHRHICSGHLTLIKNELWLQEVFRLLIGWEDRLEDPSRFQWHQSLTEAHLTAIFCPIRRTRDFFSQKLSISAPNDKFYKHNYFREQWSTPFTPKAWLGGSENHPDSWYWNNGVLTNNYDGTRTFLYLHLMNYKSKCWVNEKVYGDASTWSRLEHCLHFDVKELATRSDTDRTVLIDRGGIHLLEAKVLRLNE